jgi:hypothetical protein
MSDPVINSVIKPQYFQQRKSLPEKILDKALGEISSNPDIKEKYLDLAYKRSIEAGRTATNQAQQKMGMNESGLLAIAKSTAAWTATGGSSPGDYGKKVKEEFFNKPDLKNAVVGMMQLGTAAKAIQETTGKKPADTSKMDPQDATAEITKQTEKQDNVMKALAHLGRNEKPDASTINNFFEGQKKTVGDSDKLSSEQKNKFLDKLDKQQEKTLDLINGSSDTKVSMSNDVLKEMVKLDPDFKESFDPRGPLSSLTQNYLESRMESAVKDGFPDSGILKPKDMQFSTSNFEKESSIDTFDAIKGGQKVLEQFTDENKSGFNDIASKQIIKGLDEEIDKD